jgi:hypothetical protein
VPALSRDITAGRHFCHTCKRITDWDGERIQSCDGCGERFPCAHLTCTHWDCAESRAVWGNGDWTDVFCGVE